MGGSFAILTYRDKILRGGIIGPNVELTAGLVDGKGQFAGPTPALADSEKEANREGVLPIELVDGERLVELFEAKELGLRRKEVFEVDHSFFEQFR